MDPHSRPDFCPPGTNTMQSVMTMFSIPLVSGFLYDIDRNNADPHSGEVHPYYGPLVNQAPGVQENKVANLRRWGLEVVVRLRRTRSREHPIYSMLEQV